MKKIKLTLLFATALIAINMAVLSCSDDSHSSEPTYCKVTFMNLETEFKTELIESGKKVTEPTPPTRSGYTFSGWYDNDSKFDFSKSITSDIILTARWTAEIPSEITYTITFNSAGGNEIASQIVKSGEKATVPTQPTREGYEFLGWYDKTTIFDFESTSISKNISLTAKWKLKVPNYLEVEEGKDYDDAAPYYVITGYINENFPENGTIMIPESISEIDYRAFENCTALTAIYIPASVTCIYTGAFRGCINLKSATFETKIWYYKPIASPTAEPESIHWQDARSNASELIRINSTRTLGSTKEACAKS